MTTPTNPTSSVSIDPDTRMGTVALTVSDVSRARNFYERTIGLRGFEPADGSVALAAEGGNVLIELRGERAASRLDRRATGLFHFAILVPTRRDLAFALVRIAESEWPLDGASDHLVSEALYLSDPDGNGIEIYRDRPREQWRWSGEQLEMDTLPLDLRGVLAELGETNEEQPLLPAQTKIGHVHLQVSDLDEAGSFYNGVLGFDVTVRGYPGALFVSAGGYHHHLGLNTWNSAGGSPPPPGSVGLRHFQVTLPNDAALEAVLERIRSAGLDLDTGEAGVAVRDPSGNRVLLRAA